MGALAEMSLETASCQLRRGQVVLANVEINNRCAFTNICESCYLNLLESGTASLSEAQVLSATAAMIHHGAEINHFVVAGKEAFESGELLLAIAQQYWHQSHLTRPGSLGVLSASAPGIERWLPRFAKSPLSWLAVSVDADSSGLRAGDPFRVLNAALRGRDAGGTQALAVNTTFHDHSIDAVHAIGRHLHGLAIDQWTTSPLMLPVDGRMRTSVSLRAVEQMIRVAEELIDVADRIVVETELHILRNLVGAERWQTIDQHRWRVEVQLDSGVWLYARSPMPGFFLRIRHDGALMSKDDFTKVNLTAGRYGKFADPADIDAAMKRLANERMQMKHPGSSPRLVSSIAATLHS